MVQVSQAVYDVSAAQITAFQANADNYAAERDAAESSRAYYQDLTDGFQSVLDDLEVGP